MCKQLGPMMLRQHRGEDSQAWYPGHLPGSWDHPTDYRDMAVYSFPLVPRSAFVPSQLPLLPANACGVTSLEYNCSKCAVSQVPTSIAAQVVTVQHKWEVLPSPGTVSSVELGDDALVD
jgi:hypothetical protein